MINLNLLLYFLQEWGIGYFEVTFRDKNDKQRNWLMEIDDSTIEHHEIVFPTSGDIEVLQADKGYYPDLDETLCSVESTIHEIIVDGFGARIIIERTNLINVRGFTS